MQRLLNFSADVAKLALAAMLILQFCVVIGRYVFGTSAAWLSESVVFAHAVVFMLAAGWTLASGRHVAIDVLSEKLGHPRGLGLAGFLLFLIPFVIGCFLLSIPSVTQSWSLLEGSSSVGGLPGVFLLKTLLPVFAGLLLLGGIAQLLRRG